METAGSERHPFEVFLLVVCVISGAGLLLGSPPPGSINATLDPLARTVWALLLACGSASALVGMAWPGGVILEQVGLVAVGGGTLVYAAAILVTVHWSGAFPAGLTLAFGCACFWRWWQIQRRIRRFRGVS